MIASWLARPLWQRIMVASILGVFAGVVGGTDVAAWARPLGDVYINLLRMIVTPLVFVCVMASIMRLRDVHRPMRKLMRTLLWFVITAAAGVIVGCVVAVIAKPGLGLGSLIAEQVKPKEIPSLVALLINIVPSNPLRAFVDGNMLQLLFLASVFGAGLYALNDKVASIRAGVMQIETLIHLITRWVLQLSPLGTFGLIAWVVGQYGLTSLMPLAKFTIALYIACLVQIMVVYGGIIKLHGLSVHKFFRSIFSAQQMAFATSSSVATLPLSLRVSKESLGVDENFASFALPLGAMVKMDGCGAIYPAIASVFIAQYFAIDLTSTQYLLICFTAVIGSFATVGAPGTSLVILTMTLASAGLPLEGIGYIFAADRIIDMIRTATNVTGQLVVTTVVAREEGLLDMTIYNGEPSPVIAQSVGSAD